MRFAALGLVVVAVLVLFTGLSSVGFLDEREARNLAVAVNLRTSVERLTPILGGDPLLERPLLGYALDLAVAGNPSDDPAVPRAVRGMAALALVALTGWIGARRFGARTGVLAALVLLSSVGTPFAARTDGPQLLGSLFDWLACAGFMAAMFGPLPGRARALVGAYTAIGLALLAAGPIPALWPIGGLALYLALVRTPRGWRALAPGWGALLALGIALPWYGPMLDLHREAFLSRLAWFPYAGTPHAPWFRAPLAAASVLLAAAFPWCAMLPGALIHADAWWRSGRTAVADPAADPTSLLGALDEQIRLASQSHLLIAWLTAATLPLVLYPQPPLSAGLAALPAVALLVGRLLDHTLERPERVRAAIASASGTLALVGVPFAIFVAISATRAAANAVVVRELAILLLLTTVAPALAMFAGRPRVAALLFAAPVVFGTPLVAVRVLPAFEDSLTTRRLVATFERVSPNGAALLVRGAPPSSLRLYLDRPIAVTDSLARDLSRVRARDGYAYAVVRPDEQAELTRARGVVLEPLARSPRLVLIRARVP